MWRNMPLNCTPVPVRMSDVRRNSRTRTINGQLLRREILLASTIGKCSSAPYPIVFPRAQMGLDTVRFATSRILALRIDLSRSTAGETEHCKENSAGVGAPHTSQRGKPHCTAPVVISPSSPASAIRFLLRQITDEPTFSSTRKWISGCFLLRSTPIERGYLVR